MKLHSLLVAPIVMASSLGVGAPQTSNNLSSDPESHCIVQVIDQLADGELIFGQARCFSRFSDMLEQMAEEALPIDSEQSPAELLALTDIEEMLDSSFTLGIHFDGANGSGSSISVVGSSCTGGWWNTGTTWGNRISSSWNGCYRLKHHDGPNKTGASESTVGTGATHNLSIALNNKAESVSYWSS